MTDSTPSLMDGMSESFAKLYGEPLFALPNDLYIPPDALEIFLEAFEGPLDLLLYLIRKQNFSLCTNIAVTYHHHKCRKFIIIFCQVSLSVSMCR